MNEAHLLVIEDEVRLLNHLCRGLGEAGFTVMSAGSAEAAERAVATGEFSAIVLDLRLPGKDGLEFLRGLRAAGNAIPVLILTARSSLEERVSGLDAGADDYLAKPFAFAELVARIRALIRRQTAAPQPRLRFADLEFDPVKRRARRGTRELNLSPKETILLELLMRNAGQAVTRAMIAEVVWGPGYNDFTNLIEVFVNRLRSKIGIDGDEPLIATIRGVGYSMRPPPGGGEVSGARPKSGGGVVSDARPKS
ncbi:MAG TPA: response regulator transcription factor [Candidatus Binataceae bacterium]|nr:response regulator transcription factor [Candidatus Binataceae bacterium]